MKIGVLCMSCNQDIYKYQEMVARNTWIKHLKEEGIDVFIFTSGKEQIIDDKIYCDVLDDVNHTYEKTINAMRQIDIDKYDFIIRTNLTTYINAKLLKLYCQYLESHNYDMSNGCLMIKDQLIHYRGNSLIISNKVVKYLLDNIYDNKLQKQDDFIFQNIFIEIPHLFIHSAPLRYYSNEGHFLYHPQSIHKINKETLEGIVFISYRIILDINNKNNINSIKRFEELGRCYEIDSFYDKLNNDKLSNNLGIIFNGDINNFIKCNSIVQENSKIKIL